MRIEEQIKIPETREDILILTGMAENMYNVLVEKEEEIESKRKYFIKNKNIPSARNLVMCKHIPESDRVLRFLGLNSDGWSQQAVYATMDALSLANYERPELGLNQGEITKVDQVLTNIMDRYLLNIV